MDEHQRRLRAQYVDPRERINRLERRLLVQVGQRSCLAGIGVVAEDRDSLRKRRRLRRKPREAKRDGARAGPRPELAQAGHVRVGGRQTLDGDHKHELTQEQRIASRLFPAGCAEGVLGRG